MTQHQLDRAVARATGESVEFIRTRGFSMVIVPRRRYRPLGGGAQARARQTRRADQDAHQSKAA